MELKIIGTGSTGNAYVLENENEALLIECGVRFSEIKTAIDFNLSKVVGCIVSHLHGDHARSIQDVVKSGIDVFALNETLAHWKIENSHRAKSIVPKETFKIGGFTILAFDVKHDVPCLGFLISHFDCGKVLFVTDTYYCKYRFSGLNNIIVEANYSAEIIYKRLGPESGKEFLKNRIIQSHFSIENCKGLLAANDLSKVNNIVLIHLSDGNSNEKQFKEEVFELTGKNVSVASNGMKLKFNKTPF